ncbi:MAG: hypothetical protein JWN72_1708 [Thermoleophilia bacterium]|nr:hypothetical protein [Thermoleophilia bacterium]
MDPITACLLGGAVGDALGEPIEFLKTDEIRARFGPAGITGPVDPTNLPCSDDTQMTLFTAEGIIRHAATAEPGASLDEPALLRSVHDAYQRWLRTQGEPSAYAESPAHAGRIFGDGATGLLAHAELHHRRAPGDTCIAGLQADRAGSVADPLNDRRGCGGIMRVAPVGLAFDASEVDVFGIGCATAALTHGDPAGYLPAGVLAHVVSRLARGGELEEALDEATATLRDHDGHELTLELLERARADARTAPPTPDAIEAIGGGWQGHDALGIGVYCVLATSSFTEAVLVGANHGGDCDSTASIAGSLAALVHGGSAIDPDWIELLDLHRVLLETADALRDVAGALTRG